MSSLTKIRHNVFSETFGLRFRTSFVTVSLLVLFPFSQVNAQSEEVDLPREAEEKSTSWIAEDINLSVFGDENADSFLGKSELWADQWGISAQLKQSDNQALFGLPKDSSFFNLDVKRRFGINDKSNVELGLGWQEMSIDSQIDASGPRVSLGGNYSFMRDFQVYGLTSFFPELEDNTQNNEGIAYEFEAGLLYKPLPSLSLKAGYRVFTLETEDSLLDDLGSSSGFLLGTDVSW